MTMMSTADLQQERLWVDIHLQKYVMDFLWSIIDGLDSQIDSRGQLAGNISKSLYLEDKNNFFYERVLKGMSEQLYFRDSWKNYFDAVVSKTISHPKFKLKEMWVNYQKQYEFNPPHSHGGLYSFVVFMKIPTHWKEQHALPISANSNSPSASDFQFLLGQEHGYIQDVSLPLSPEDEGRILFFPAWLHHQVFPFYECEEERITIAGNISMNEAPSKL